MYICINHTQMTDSRIAKQYPGTFSSKRLLSIMPLVLYRLLLHTGWKRAIKIHSGNIIIAKFLFLCFSCLINYGIFVFGYFVGWNGSCFGHCNPFTYTLNLGQWRSRNDVMQALTEVWPSCTFSGFTTTSLSIVGTRRSDNVKKYKNNPLDLKGVPCVSQI